MEDELILLINANVAKTVLICILSCCLDSSDPFTVQYESLGVIKSEVR